jgi:hypothetical protein
VAEEGEKYHGRVVVAAISKRQRFVFAKEYSSRNLWFITSFPQMSSQRKQVKQVEPLNLLRSLTISLHQKDPFFDIPGNLPTL